MKKYSTFLDIKEMQIKPHEDSTSLLLERLSSRTQTTTNVGEYIGEKDPSYAVGGNVN
jgi:hypothetical protein